MAPDAPARVSGVFLFYGKCNSIGPKTVMFAKAMGIPYKWFVLLLLLVAGPVFGQAKRDKLRQQLNMVYGAEMLSADIDVFHQALQQGHPDLYRYVPKRQLDSLIVDLKAKSHTLSLRQFYNQLNHIGSLIGCGHLLISYPKPLEKYFQKYAYYPPLHLEVGDGHAVPVKNLMGGEVPAKAVVKSINGIQVDSLVRQINHHLMRDGYTLTANDWLMYRGWFNEFYIRYIEDSSQYNYVLQTPTDTGFQIQQLTLPGLDYTTLKFPRKKRPKPEQQLTLTYDEDTRTAILTIKSFDPMAIRRGKQKYNKFIREAFWHIYQTRPEQLIIDLRDNEGGNSFYPEQLIGYLSQEPYRLYRNMEIKYRTQQQSKPPLLNIKGKRGYRRIEKQSIPVGNGNLAFKKFTDQLIYNFPYAYPGTVYVMVNGGTYSAASELACYLKEHVSAVVVGSETGGSCDPITAGMFGSATLPHTGIVVSIPLIAFEKDLLITCLNPVHIGSL